MPAFRQTSSTIVLSSACLSMNTICCSLNLAFFIGGFPRPAHAKPNQEFLTINGPTRAAYVNVTIATRSSACSANSRNGKVSPHTTTRRPKHTPPSSTQLQFRSGHPLFPIHSHTCTGCSPPGNLWYILL